MDSLIVKSKVCTACRKEKLLEEFGKHPMGKYGRKSKCKVCWVEYNKQYNKQYYQDNKEKLAEEKKQYRQNNKETISQWNKQYYQENKKQILERNKQYYEANKEKIAEWRKQYEIILERKRDKK